MGFTGFYCFFSSNITLYRFSFGCVVFCGAGLLDWLNCTRSTRCLFVCFFLFKDEFQWAFTRFHRTISVHGRRSSENSAKNSANAKHGSAALSVHVLRFPCTTSNRIASFSDTTDCCSYTPPLPHEFASFFFWLESS